MRPTRRRLTRAAGRRGRRRRTLALAALALSLAAAPSAVLALPYRLHVASLHQSAFYSFLGGSELLDGATGPGLDRLQAALDRGLVPQGALLWDRLVQAAPEAIARAHGGVPVTATVSQGGEGGRLWDEVRWEGVPGERSVWLISPTGRPQRAVRLALKGEGRLRQFQPYAGPPGLAVLRTGLGWVWAEEERGVVHVSRALDLRDGVGVLVAENFNPTFADHVYIVVRHTERPTTFEAVIAWQEIPEPLEWPRRRWRW
jgi:hypothetical protein